MFNIEFSCPFCKRNHKRKVSEKQHDWLIQCNLNANGGGCNTKFVVTVTLEPKITVYSLKERRGKDNESES